MGVCVKKENSLRKQTVVRQLPLLVFLFCVAQPVLDVLTYWQNAAGLSNAVTVVLRMGLLGGSVLLGFQLSEKRWQYVATAGGFSLFCLARVLIFWFHGDPEPLGDLSNMVRIGYLPLVALSMGTFLQCDARVIRAVRDGVAVNLVIIAAVMLLSRLTGTDPYTYPNKALGVRGWFLVPSPQSAVVSMIAPVAMGWALNKWDKELLPVAAVTALALGVLLLYATRLAIASMVAAGLGMAVCLLLIAPGRWKQSAVIAAVTAVCMALIPLSPFAANQARIAENMVGKQELVDRYVSAGMMRSDPQGYDEALLEAYEHYVPGLISRFGGEATLEAYDRTTDAAKIADVRHMKLLFSQLQMEKSPAIYRIFGMNRNALLETVTYTDGVTEELCFDPENDFHGMYYLCGVIGLAGTLGMLLFFAGWAIYALVIDFKRHFTVDFAACSIACCIGVVYGVCTASTLRHNSASVYFAMVLAVLWYLSRPQISARRMLSRCPKDQT